MLYPLRSGTVILLAGHLASDNFLEFGQRNAHLPGHYSHQIIPNLPHTPREINGKIMGDVGAFAALIANIFQIFSNGGRCYLTALL
jgi:hypothetical protein